MKTIKGDLIKLADEGNFDIIIHGCNCFCTMGGGIARSIADKWYDVYEADKETELGDKNKLGSYTKAEIKNSVGGTFTVINAYTQFGFSMGGDVFEYDALKQALVGVRDEFDKCRIGLPMIGAGLAGGDWGRIEGIIKEVLDDKFDVTIVVYGG